MAWFLIIILIAIAGQADLEEAQAVNAEYCEMVALWHKSGKKAGWPPFNGECAQPIKENNGNNI